ncbi:MAG: hypothetical protein P9L99_08175 [Candidatus Lernaella stagnicola]|nr:hypothetical protein [Candidatus Lernaella stagnicola]
MVTGPGGMASSHHMAELREYVIERFQEGEDKFSIARSLQTRGVARPMARELVEQVEMELNATAATEVTPANYVLGFVGGLLGAIVSGVVWIVVLIFADYEVGLLALAMGFATGFGVALFSGGKQSVLLNAWAVLSSVLSLAACKYYTFYFFLKQIVAEEHGQEVAGHVTLFGKTLNAFFSNATAVFSFYDILWVILAAITAHRTYTARVGD